MAVKLGVASYSLGIVMSNEAISIISVGVASQNLSIGIASRGAVVLCTYNVMVN